MKFVKANGLVVHYLDLGPPDGPPLVFINSLGTDLRIWTEVAGILALNFRIVTYDKRGHGLSNPDRIRTRWPTTRAISRRFWIAPASVGPRSSILHGGMIAQEFYRQRPERVAALVLCDTAAKIGTDESFGTSGSLTSSAGASRRRRLGPRAVVHRPFRARAIRRACGHARHADANAETRLSRRLRRLEAR